jgi:hypothetical protein
MQTRRYPSFVAVASFGSALVLAAGLAACTTAQSPSSDAGSFLVAQGKYRFYDCGQLAKQAMASEKRQRELTALIAKANQGAGGGLVSTLSYEPDLAVARGELAEIRRERAEKKCPAEEPSRRTMTLPRS